ncbi:MAG: hypothetical protein R2822_13450 [Spirosomataceae bacterium]
MLAAKAEIDFIEVEDKQIDNQISGRMDYIWPNGLALKKKHIVEAYGKSIETSKLNYAGTNKRRNGFENAI